MNEEELELQKDRNRLVGIFIGDGIVIGGIFCLLCITEFLSLGLTSRDALFLGTAFGVALVCLGILVYQQVVWRLDKRYGMGE